MIIIFQKYKQIILPLVIVIFLDLSLLVLNSYISVQLKIAAININIAGRQRMLSQKITKSVVLLHYRGVQNINFKKDQQELENSIALFFVTLTAFAEGGFITDAAGERIFIDKLKDNSARKIIVEAQEIWSPLHLKLVDLLLVNNYQDSKTRQLIELLSANNSSLLKLMNDLTVLLEVDAKRKTYFLRAVQTVVVIMILWSFVIATLHFYRREKYYNKLMEMSTDIVIGIDVKTAVTTFVSNSVHIVLGHKSEYYLAKSSSLFFVGESRTVVGEILENIKISGNLEKDRCEVTLIKSNGRLMIADMVMQLSKSEDGKNKELIADIRDISERKKAEIALFELAHKDALTDLPNRLLFFELAEHAINLAKRNKKRFSILFIDLDGFKSINDDYGHDVGDKVLVEVAKRIKNCLRSSDDVSRIGGDEFTVILSVWQRKDIKAVGRKIINSVSQTIVVDDQNLKLGTSIGVAIYPENGSDIKSLIKKADSAMYEVKKSGKNNILFA